MRYGHGIADYGQTISCGQGACARTFESFSGLRRHFKRCHQEGENGNDHDAPVQGDLDLHDEDDGDISIDEVDIDTIDEELDILSQEGIEQRAFTFVV